MLETLTNLWKSYNEILKTQPVLAGMVTLYGVGVFTYLFKSLPMRFYNYVKSQFLVNVIIQNHDNMFEYFTNWLETDNKVWRCKNFLAYSVYKQEGDHHMLHPSIKIGFGNHLVIYKKWPYFVSRSEKDLNNSKETKELLSITTFGISADRIHKMLKDVLPKPSVKSQIHIYERDGQYWKCTNRVAKRDMASVALPDRTLVRLKAHVDQFLNSKEWYKKYEIPYRTGIILEGPPGTGKTSTSLAICGEFNCDLFIVNLSSTSDSNLANMFKSIPEKAVVLIEDIDSYKVATSREPVRVKPKEQPADPTDMTKEEIAKEPVEGFFDMGSLSGLLNAIDGVASSEDRILIATTNHIEKLDKALIRPGRFELILKIDNMCDEVCRKMFKKFYPSFYLPETFRVRPGISPAEFQCLAIANKNEPQALVSFCEYKMVDFDAEDRAINS